MRMSLRPATALLLRWGPAGPLTPFKNVSTPRSALQTTFRAFLFAATVLVSAAWTVLTEVLGAWFSPVVPGKFWEDCLQSAATTSPQCCQIFIC